MDISEVSDRIIEDMDIDFHLDNKPNSIYF